MTDAAPRPKKKVPRVERRGRFTITELEPDSPASNYNAPTFGTLNGIDHGHDGTDADDDGVVVIHESGDDGDVEEGGDYDPRRRSSLARDSAAAAALFASSTSERISPLSSAVFDHSNGAVCIVDGTGASPTTQAIEDALDDATNTAAHDNRRIKQKGRFTIIELSNDSPRSRRDSAEEFSNTTSISVTSTQVSQAKSQSYSTSPTTSGAYDLHGATTPSAVFARMMSENNTAPTRATRSMVETHYRDHEMDANHIDRRSTGEMRSVSPPRERGSSYHHPLSSSVGGTPSTPFRTQTFDSLPPLTTSPPTTPALSPLNGISSLSLSSSYSSVTGAMPIPSMTPTGVEKRQSIPEPSATRRHLASRQKAITISAEQFIQQQHTIASLIRQQQELKQLIGVLAEQQQHLISMPKQLEDFRLDQAQSDAQEDSMREVQLQVGALSRANEALQNLLSEAEQDAHERTMEIECLSNENNELRYRFSHMERRYHEEKKRSLTLEQELQRTRRALYTARNKDKGDLQKYQLKLVSRGSSRDKDGPIENQSSAAMAV